MCCISEIESTKSCFVFSLHVITGSLQPSILFIKHQMCQQLDIVNKQQDTKQRSYLISEMQKNPTDFQSIELGL